MAEHAALVVAARVGLPVGAGEQVHIDTEDVEDVVQVCRMDRLGGMLQAAIDGGAVTVDAEGADEIRRLFHAQLVAAVTAEALTVRVADVFAGADVDWRLTKGPALAHLDYPDPNVRLFGDVDLVVHPQSWDAALTALGEAGFNREQPELAPGFDHRFGKGATLSTPEELEVDLHRRLAIGRFGVLLPTEEMFTDGDSLALAGRLLPVLDQPSRLLHACFHATLGGFRHLRAHRDVAQLLLVTGVQWERTVEVASRHHVEAVVATAVRDAWSRLGLEAEHPAHQWARELRVSRRDARAIAVFTAERPFAAQALTAVPVVFGRGSIAYLTALARSRRRRGGPVFS